jgi:hypothetical protein
MKGRTLADQKKMKMGGATKMFMGGVSPSKKTGVPGQGPKVGALSRMPLTPDRRAALMDRAGRAMPNMTADRVGRAMPRQMAKKGGKMYRNGGKC